MQKWFPWLLWIGCALWVSSSFCPPKEESSLDFQKAGQLPALAGGRLKPLDTVARTSLLSIYGKQTLRIQGQPAMTAMEWLMEVMAKPEDADQRQIFRIDNPDVLDLLGFKPEQGKYYSLKSIQPRLDEIERQAALAEPVESAQRSLFQKSILKLFNQLQLYTRLKNTLQVEGSTDLPEEFSQFEKCIPAGLKAVKDQEAGRPVNKKDLDPIFEYTSRYHYLSQTAYLMVVPSPEGKWMNMGEALLQTIKTGRVDPVVRLYGDVVDGYRNKNPAKFNPTVASLRERLLPLFPHEFAKVHFEYFFNILQPFYKSLLLYVLAFILVLLSWLFASKFLNRTAFQIALIAFVVHTFGLIARMYIQERPPVTNLYSSAIFVGWGAVLLGLVLEVIHKEGIGLITSSTLGFLTLLIAHNLSLDGDTMEMMRAVLDTNIWLATHVVVVTLGYASTFLAGFLGLVYIIRSYFNRLDEALARSLNGMIYGIVCFATLFSFVGTVLGGIWADQSWGRFWGWDPKENGALIIVLWNALILHARWAGMIKQRGLAVMVVFGNVVTSFSWFGVNMLGVGLHSYGFMDKAFFWLSLFMAFQLAVMALGLLPPHPRPNQRSPLRK